MRPIRTLASNFTFTAPPGLSSCGDLPCKLVQEEGYQRVESVWVPTPEQRAALAAGANLEVIVRGGQVPPMAFDITYLGEKCGRTACHREEQGWTHNISGKRYCAPCGRAINEHNPLPSGEELVSPPSPAAPTP